MQIVKLKNHLNGSNIIKDPLPLCELQIKQESRISKLPLIQKKQLT